MPFKPDKPAPQFADLKGILAQSKVPDNALDQTLTTLIDRLDQLGVLREDIVQDINNSVNNITNLVTVSTVNNSATFVTSETERPQLPNSRKLMAGTNVALDYQFPDQLYINVTGAGGGPHAPTHSQGGSDPVDVKNLAGYPGGTTAFLRADHTFAVPPGGAGGGMNLDYLGDYVQGPVYNDGDIVIGQDGIAYMCTVDGTVTPPEPWPGVGIAANVALDATYWVVNTHPNLVNARVMNGKGTGYVRSTAGEPSVVATIPLTDTTGILPDNRLTSNVALKNIDNHFTAAQTMPSYTNVTGSFSLFYLNDTDAAVNNRIWRFLNFHNGALYIEAMDDSQLTGIASYTFGRDGFLTAPKFSGDGASLTNLNASNLATGLANPARLGNGTANSSTFLRGDSTWATPAGVPAGMIIISMNPCPIGWTRVSGWDGLMLRAGPTYGVQGGAANHSHGSGSLGIPAHDHGGQVAGTTDYDGTHGHSWGGSFSGRTSDSIGGSSGADAGGSFTAPYNAHSHDYSGTVGGQTGDGGNHAHNFRTSIPSQGGIGVTGGTDSQGNHPPFIDVIFCQKD